MGEKLDKVINVISEKYILLLLGIITLVPSFKILSFLPSVEITDLLFPIVLYKVILDYTKSPPSRFEKRLFLLFVLFELAVLISIVANNRFFFIRDYFEFFKIIKWGIYAVFVSNTIQHINIDKTIKVVFSILVVLNISHFFNLFGFNDWGEIYYTTIQHLKSFGVNSLGLPATKRMIGTMSNPNNNALLFLFFVVYFLVQLTRKLSFYKVLFFLTSILMFILCQSRTSLLALLGIFLLHFVINRSWKYIPFYLGLPLMYALIFFIDNSVENQTLTNVELSKHMEELKKKECAIMDSERKESADLILFYTDNEQFTEANFQKDLLEIKEIKFSERMSYIHRFIKKKKEYSDSQETFKYDGAGQVNYLKSTFDSKSYSKKSSSLGNRYATWEFLWNQVKEKPIFGHGPNKEYFYTNGIYSENEYILILWRYGFFGSLAFLLVAFFPLYLIAFRTAEKQLDFVFLFGIAFLVCGLTNTPFSNAKLVLLWSFVLGIAINIIKSRHAKKTFISRS